MKSRDKWIIGICFALAVALLFVAVSVLGKVTNPEKETFWDKISIFDDDSDETSEDTTTPAEDISPSETTDSGSLEEYTPHTLTFNLGETDSDIKLGYVQSTENELFSLLVHTSELKANTSYRISWTIDEAMFTDTKFYLRSEEVDGTEKYCFMFDSNYTGEGDSFKLLYTSSYQNAIDGYYDFNSAADGSDMAFAFLIYDNPNNSISYNEFPSLFTVAQIKPYLTFTITELVG